MTDRSISPSKHRQQRQPRTTKENQNEKESKFSNNQPETEIPEQRPAAQSANQPVRHKRQQEDHQGEKEFRNKSGGPDSLETKRISCSVNSASHSSDRQVYGPSEQVRRRSAVIHRRQHLDNIRMEVS